MRRLHISQSIGDICSRYESTNTNNSEASSSSSIANGRLYNTRLYKSSVINSATGGFLQKSNSEVICKRGFKPSDRYDPQKKRFLTSLTSKFWKKENDLLNCDSKQIAPNGKKIDLKKLFTPAADFEEHYICPRTHKKMYANSSFYSPNHPTVEEQLELARRISRSLSDISNQRSKGQSMFVNRKKRSVKWVHEGEGKGAPLEEETSITEKEHLQGKKSLKLVMNPRGHVQDLESLRRLGYNIEPTAVSPEICFDLVRDMNTTKGKGAELFAKRRRKSEKWVVDGTSNSGIGRDAEGSGKTGKSSNSIFSADFISGTDDVLSNNNFYQSSYENAQYEQKWFDCDPRIKGDLCYGSLQNRSKTKVADDLCKPKIPRGWSTEYHGQHHKAEYDSVANGKSSALSSVNFQAFETNNYNTAARGWQPNMQYYRPVTFQKRLSYTNF